MLKELYITLQMVLPPAPKERHVPLQIPHHLQMLKPYQTLDKVNVPPPLIEDHKDTL